VSDPGRDRRFAGEVVQRECGRAAERAVRLVSGLEYWRGSAAVERHETAQVGLGERVLGRGAEGYRQTADGHYVRVVRVHQTCDAAAERRDHLGHGCSGSAVRAPEYLFRVRNGIVWRRLLQVACEGASVDLQVPTAACTARTGARAVTEGHVAVLTAGYREEKVGESDTRVVLGLKPELAPVKIAVSPLLRNKPELVEKAREVFATLKKKYGAVMFDDNGNIGKRYRRQDEIGTPLCVVIDFDTLEDHAVTVRHRDTMEQSRIKIAELQDKIDKLLGSF